ncbi:MAG: hypothetical protein GY861_12840 [bacterium]|nr:hypothetical protein [bacterium]
MDTVYATRNDLGELMKWHLDLSQRVLKLEFNEAKNNNQQTNGVIASLNRLVELYESGEWVDEPLLVDRIKDYLGRIAQQHH